MKLYSSGYKIVDFKYNLVHKNNNKRSRQRNIIPFNPPFSQAVSTNIAKRFLNLLDKHFPQNNQLHKIFNRNTVKISYFLRAQCAFHYQVTQKKLTNAENKQTKHCNCRKKQECPLEGKSRSEDIIYKCVVTATGHPRKVYLGTAKGDFKQRYYNHKKSFKNRKYANEASLSKYIWEMKDKHSISPNLMWCKCSRLFEYLEEMYDEPT